MELGTSDLEKQVQNSQIRNKPFPHAKRRKLAAPPIELILAQVKFPMLAELFTPQGFVPFAAAIRKDYPSAVPIHEIGIELSEGKFSEVGRTPVWKFEDLKRTWTVTLAPEFLALEVKGYVRFSDYRDRFEELWGHVRQIYRVTHRTRLGLRYVDKFATNKQAGLPENWFDMVERDTFPMNGLDRSIDQAGNIAHAFDVEPGLGLVYRAAFKRHADGARGDREFVLDLDCFDSRTVEAAALTTQLDQLKELTHNAFWWTFGRLLDVVDPPHATSH